MKCRYCKKKIWFFPVTPQGKNTKYHSKCFDKYTGDMLQMAMTIAIQTKVKGNILIEV